MRARQLTVPLSICTLLAFAPSGAADGNAKPAMVKITASAVPWTVVGTELGITGKVTPHVAGIRVTLQQGRGGSWQPIGVTKARSNGAFAFETRPSHSGAATYRVVTSSGAVYVGTSPSVSVNVFEWTYLASIYSLPNYRGNWSSDPIVSNGVHYAHPIALDAGCYNAWGGDAFIEYGLGRRYETFSTTLGLADEPDSGRTNLSATYKIIGDSKVLASGNLVVGTSRKLAVSVQGMLRLQLFINDPNNNAGCGPKSTQVVFGDAQLLGP